MPFAQHEAITVGSLQIRWLDTQDPAIEHGSRSAMDSEVPTWLPRLVRHLHDVSSDPRGERSRGLDLE